MSDKPKEFWIDDPTDLIGGQWLPGNHAVEQKEIDSGWWLKLIEKSAYDKAIKALKLFIEPHTCSNKTAFAKRTLFELGEL